MSNFSSPLAQATCSTTYKSAGILIGAAAHRVQLYEVEMGQTGGLSSSDCQVQWDISRFANTNLLTATSTTPMTNDEADSAASCTFFNLVLSELTVTTIGAGLNLKNWGLNQRGSYRWRALDNGDQLMIAATASKGFAFRALSVSFTGSLVGNISYLER